MFKTSFSFNGEERKDKFPPKKRNRHFFIQQLNIRPNILLYSAQNFHLTTAEKSKAAAAGSFTEKCLQKWLQIQLQPAAV